MFAGQWSAEKQIRLRRGNWKKHKHTPHCERSARDWAVTERAKMPTDRRPADFMLLIACSSRMAGGQEACKKRVRAVERV